MVSGVENIATKDDLTKFKDDLSKQINALMKWMFIFWITQIGATLAIFLLVLKK